MSNRVLVTGGRGFVGRHLVERLAGEHCTVRILDHDAERASMSTGPHTEVVHGDIGDMNAATRAAEGCETLYHLAAKTTESRAGSNAIHDVNLVGTQVLAQAAAKARVKRFVFCSTGGVYGSRFKGPVAEDGPKRPNTPYRVSKWKAEQWLQQFGPEHGLPVVVARPASVTGPGAKGWLGLLAAIKTGHFRTIRPGTHQLHACDVLNIVEGLVLCGEVEGIEGEAFNIVDESPCTFLELVTHVAEHLGVGLGNPSPRWPFDAYNKTSELLYHATGRHLPRATTYEMLLRERTFDCTKARQRLGYRPGIGYRESIVRMADWALEEGLL